MKKNKKKILIFYQSAIELVDILDIIKRYPFGSCVIVVTGQKEFLYVLNKLKVKKKFGVEIYKFFGLSFSNPINLFKMYFRYRFSKDSKSILKYSFQEAFFFNQHVDFVAPIFLAQCIIKKINHIVVYDGSNYEYLQKKYPLKNQTNINLKYKLKFLFIKILYHNLNIKIFLQKNKFYELIYFHLLDKKIQKILPTNKNISRFSLIIGRRVNKKKKLLYIDSNEEILCDHKFEDNFNKILDIFEINDYQIIIKKHLREKLSEVLKNKKQYIYLTDPIPLELYDLKDIDLIVGFRSIALARIAAKYPHKKCLSIIKLFLSKKLSEQFKIEFSSLSKKNKLLIPDNLKNLDEIIKR